MYFADVPLYRDRKLSQLIISKLNFRGSVGISGNLLYALSLIRPARHFPFLFFLFFYSHRENKGARRKERGRQAECLYHNFMLYGFLQNHSHKLCRVTTGYRPAVIPTPLTYTGRDRRHISPQPGTIEMGGDLSRFSPRAV